MAQGIRGEEGRRSFLWEKNAKTRGKSSFLVEIIISILRIIVDQNEDMWYSAGERRCCYGDYQQRGHPEGFVCL